MKKILIIRFSSMGDIVLTSPVIRCAAKQWNAEIHVLTKPAFAALYESNPNISRIFTHQNGMDLTQKLNNERYDLIIDLHNNIRSRLVTMRLNAPVRRFFKANVQKWLTVRFKYKNILPDKHIVHRYFDALINDGIVYDDRGLDFYFPNDFDSLNADTFISDTKAHGYILMALGGTYFTKRIPFEIAAEIIKNSEQPFILSGGDDCTSVARQLKKAFPSQVTDTTNHLSIFESAYLVKHSNVVISGDSVMMHIAAALKKPLLTMWGNTIPEFGMYPLYPSGQDNSFNFEVLNLSCRPCSKLGTMKCPKGHFNCMMKQDVNKLTAAKGRYF